MQLFSVLSGCQPVVSPISWCGSTKIHILHHLRTMLIRLTSAVHFLLQSFEDDKNFHFKFHYVYNSFHSPHPPRQWCLLKGNNCKMYTNQKRTKFLLLNSRRKSDNSRRTKRTSHKEFLLLACVNIHFTRRALAFFLAVGERTTQASWKSFE